MIARICTLVALAAVLAAIHAHQSLSAVAAAAVPPACSHPAAYSHRSQALRSLSSVQTSKLVKHCQQARKSYYKVRFWYTPSHRWTLYLNHPDRKCWQLKLAGPEHLCMLARSQVRVNSAKLGALQSKIEEMTRPRLASNLLDAFTCIHEKEGAWDANTGNGYYGGLQMDMQFQRTYGPEFLRRWGTADRWPAWAQLEAARRAYVSGRGFGPWPNTHVACNLPNSLEV